MPMFRKRPVEVEAVQWTGDNGEEIDNFLPRDCFRWFDNFAGNPVILTLEGDMLVSKGDYIIRGVKGEFYPCKPDIFEATYSDASESEGKDADYMIGSCPVCGVNIAERNGKLISLGTHF